MAPRLLLLVDGTGLFYRSFFAIKGLSAHGGQPTNAVFGFIRALHQMEEFWKPTHVAVAWDGGSPEERLALLPEYKMQRAPMPDALKVQYGPLCEYLDCAGVPLIRLDRQEADDVLATLAHWAEREGNRVLIASSDKDMYQLVTDRIGVITTGKEAPCIGPAGVLEMIGLLPGQVVEWLALTGDHVDNIPGVEGVGPKTAVKLLAQFGSLATMWGRIEEVESARLREKLLAGRGVVERNLALVKLRDDLDCVPDWDALAFKPEDPGRMRPYYERMEFHSLVRKVDQPELF